VVVRIWMAMLSGLLTVGMCACGDDISDELRSGRDEYKAKYDALLAEHQKLIQEHAETRGQTESGLMLDEERKALERRESDLNVAQEELAARKSDFEGRFARFEDEREEFYASLKTDRVKFGEAMQALKEREFMLGQIDSVNSDRRFATILMVVFAALGIAAVVGFVIFVKTKEHEIEILKQHRAQRECEAETLERIAETAPDQLAGVLRTIMSPSSPSREALLPAEGSGEDKDDT